jgi:hypothetical protein
MKQINLLLSFNLTFQLLLINHRGQKKRCFRPTKIVNGHLAGHRFHKVIQFILPLCYLTLDTEIPLRDISAFYRGLVEVFALTGTLRSIGYSWTA